MHYIDPPPKVSPQITVMAKLCDKSSALKVSCLLYRYCPSSGTDPAVSSGVFVGVVAGFVAVVSVLLVVIICVFAMLKKQREKNKALEGSGMFNVCIYKIPTLSFTTFLCGRCVMCIHKLSMTLFFPLFCLLFPLLSSSTTSSTPRTFSDPLLALFSPSSSLYSFSPPSLSAPPPPPCPLMHAASSRSNSPMIKTKRMMYRSDETPSSTDTANHDYWLQSQPSIIRGQANLYSQVRV